MQDTEDEQKVLLVRLHSKKLAIAIGLRTTSCNMWKMSKKNCLLVSVTRSFQLHKVFSELFTLFGLSLGSWEAFTCCSVSSSPLKRSNQD